MNKSIKVRFDKRADSSALQFDQFENRVMCAARNHVDDSVVVKIINAMPITEFNSIIESLCSRIRATNENYRVSYCNDYITSTLDKAGLVIACTYFISIVHKKF